MEQVKHEFYDNRRPQHPLALTADVRWLVIRTEVEARVYNPEKGYQDIILKHYVERARS